MFNKIYFFIGLITTRCKLVKNFVHPEIFDRNLCVYSPYDFMWWLNSFRSSLYVFLLLEVTQTGKFFMLIKLWVLFLLIYPLTFNIFILGTILSTDLHSYLNWDGRIWCQHLTTMFWRGILSFFFFLTKQSLTHDHDHHHITSSPKKRPSYNFFRWAMTINLSWITKINKIIVRWY